MTVRKKRILIMTADAGFGHRSAAIALQEALNIRYGNEAEVTLINPLDDKRAPLFLRESQADYDKWVRKAPEIYKLGYDTSDKAVPSTILESGLAVIMFELMRDLLRKHRPDVVVSTYPLYQHAITGVLTTFKAKIPLITVVTDLATVHRLWFNDRANAILVPNEIVRDLAIENGVAPEKIVITGIPVHPQISMTDRSRRTIRAELGWNENLFTVLAVGSKRVEGLMEGLNVINHFGRPLQLAVVAGKDEEMFADLKTTDWHIPAHLYDFVTNMPELMHAADLILCKAGGLIVTESLACGLPMVLVNVIPGQETGNMEFVVQNGAGVWADDPMKVLEALAHYTANDQEQLKQAAANAIKLGKPQAAFDAAEIVWQAAQQMTTEPDLSFRSNIINLLTLNQIPWIEDEPLTSDEPEE
ncbi:MAG: MGDG synthase family glycosyltransferase [Bellilinea sp.]